MYRDWSRKMKIFQCYFKKSLLYPCHGACSSVLVIDLKSATVETKRVYKQVMDTLNKIHTKVLSLKICRPFHLRVRYIKKSLLKWYIHTVIPIYKEGISTLCIVSKIKSYLKNTLKVKKKKKKEYNRNLSCTTKFKWNIPEGFLKFMYYVRASAQ